VDVSAGNFLKDSGKAVFKSYNFSLGFSYQINSVLSIDAGYRYVSLLDVSLFAPSDKVLLENDLLSNEFSLGVRYKF
jgi:opacity protein-like surface antigen